MSEKQLRESLLLAENVALLSLLCAAPTAPHTNPSDDQFTQEAHLTNTIAYISCVSDDPSHVVAACVEGLTGRSQIRVIVAINKERPTSNKEILARIKKGLDEILGLLSRASREQDADLEDMVLDAIVRMCKDRIFSRIKSKRPDAKYSKWKSKAFLGSLLQQVIDAVRSYGNRKKFEVEVQEFTKAAVRFRDRLEDLERCSENDVVSHITGVLRAAHRLNKTTDYDKIFQGLGSRELAPTIRTGLPTRLDKLANYLECCLFLCWAAKESDIFRNAEVITVSLDANFFVRSLGVPPDCSLRSCLDRLENGAPTVLGAEYIYSKLKELGRHNNDFLSAVRKNLRESCVHAEVQIVCYYELHTEARKPRVICSSKHACYLCDLFIRLHGTFHIPGTHGNLYTRWRLLPIHALDTIQAQLNRALETQIKKITAGLISNPHQLLKLSPNEKESSVSLVKAFSSSRAGSTTLAGPSSLSASLAQVKGKAKQSPLENQHPKTTPPLTGNPAHTIPIVASDPMSSGPECLLISPAAGRGTQLATPAVLSSEWPERYATHQATMEPNGESATGMTSPVRESHVPVQASQGDLDVIKEEITPEELVPESELCSGAQEQTLNIKPVSIIEQKAAERPGPGPQTTRGTGPELKVEIKPESQTTLERGLEPGQQADSRAAEDKVAKAKVLRKAKRKAMKPLKKEAKRLQREANEKLKQGRKEAAEELKHRAKKARTAAKQAAELVEQQQQHASSAGSPSAAGEAKQERASKPGRLLEPIPELEPELDPDPVPVAVQKPQPEPVSSKSRTRSPIPTPRSSPPKEVPSQLLTRGHVLIYRLDTPDPIPAFTAGLVTIYPEFVRTLATTASCTAEVHIQWLPPRRAAAFYTARPRGFVELESVRSDAGFDSGSSECVYVAYAGEVVMLDFVRGVV